MIEHIVTSSALIAMLLALSAVLERKINPCLKYALWLLAAVKLLVPLPQFSSPISIMNVVQNTAPSLSMDGAASPNAAKTTGSETTPDNISLPDAGNAFSEVSTPDAPTRNSETTNSAAAINRQPFNTFSRICRAVWLLGAVVCTAVFLWANLRFARLLKNGRTPDGYMKTTLPSGKLPIYRSAGIASPCLFGVFHPAVYLPEGVSLTRAQRADILAHEHTHFRHGDTFWALIRCLCAALYWYNPLVWLGARACIRDSELACDYGTLKRIGNKNRIRYGRTLIAAAGAATAADTLSKRSGTRIWNCSTQAAGGKQEMKKRIQMIAKPPVTKKYHIIVLLFLCVNLVGCTFGGTAVQEQENTTLNMELPDNSTEDNKIPPDTNNSSISPSEPLTDTDTSQEDAAWNATQTEEGMIYNGIPLYRDRKENQVCIQVQPSVIRAYLSYYYIPTGELQERLTELVRGLDLTAEPFDLRWQGMKESGWRLCYQDLNLTAFDGGYLYCCWEDFETNSSMEYLIQDIELYNTIQTALTETLDYKPFDITDIQDVTSATLEMQNMFTDYALLSQTITDPDTLRILEDFFHNAAYIYGGAECGNQGVCLELTLADGRTVRLSMAMDSCTNCGINGVYYNYRPYRKKGAYSIDFYQYFDQILPFLPI